MTAKRPRFDLSLVSPTPLDPAAFLKEYKCSSSRSPAGAWLHPSVMDKDFAHKVLAKILSVFQQIVLKTGERSRRYEFTPHELSTFLTPLQFVFLQEVAAGRMENVLLDEEVFSKETVVALTGHKSLDPGLDVRTVGTPGSNSPVNFQFDIGV